MTISRIPGSRWAVLAIFVLSATAAQASTTISAADPRFTYEGRIDFSTPGAPDLVWPGTQVRIDFEGDFLALDFAESSDQNFFNVSVDGATTVIGLRKGGPARIEVPVNGVRRHSLVVFKRTEAGAGTIHFKGIEVADGAAVTKPAQTGRRPRFEFFGDSIMVGACNEDGVADQWEDRSTHNNALSYTNLTAEAFGAEFRCIAVSGIGISIGFVPVVAAQVWDRSYPRADAPRDDLAAWQPDVVFLAYGENDSGFSASHHLGFPSDYAERYVALVHAMRRAYPHAHFVILRGGMNGGANDPLLRSAWEAAVAEMEKADPAISHYVFQHWVHTHPRVVDDRAMASELVTWLRAQPFSPSQIAP